LIFKPVPCFHSSIGVRPWWSSKGA